MLTRCYLGGDIMLINGQEFPTAHKYIAYLKRQGCTDDDIIDCLVTEWGTTHLNAVSILNYYNDNE